MEFWQVAIYSWFLISFFLYWPIFFRQIELKSTRGILFARLYGAVLFGLLPVFILLILKFDVIDNLGLHLPHSDNTIWVIIGLVLGPLAGFGSFLQSKSPKNLLEFPQIRDHKWSLSLILLNAATWTIYLIGYEILFRGLLLFPFIGHTEIVLVFTLGIILYSLSHAAKNFKEAMGTIPIGVILLMIAYKTNSVWLPIWIHVCLALSNSYFSAWRHPDIKLLRR